VPSAFAHALVGASLATTLPRSASRAPAAATLALLAAAPDLDVIGFRLGIPYEHWLGHRGLTHSLFFAALCALLSLPLWRLTRYAQLWRTLGALTGAAIASHGLLDTCTNAGLGVGLLIPFSDARSFAPWRPIFTSPLSPRAFFSTRGALILANEIFWVGLPTLAIATAGRALRRKRSGDTDWN